MRRFLVFTLITIIAYSCTPKEKVDVAFQTGPVITVKALMEDCKAQRQSFKTFQGVISLKIFYDDKHNRLKEIFLFERPDKCRLEIKNPLGFPLYQGVIKGNCFAYCDYDEKVYFQSSQGVPAFDMPPGFKLTALELIDWFAGDVPGHVLDSQISLQSRYSSRFKRPVLELHARQGQWREELFLDFHTKEVLYRRHNDLLREVEITAEYDGFERFDENVTLATFIELNISQPKYKILLNIQKAYVNEQISVDAFQLPPPDDWKGEILGDTEVCFPSED